MFHHINNTFKTGQPGDTALGVQWCTTRGRQRASQWLSVDHSGPRSQIVPFVLIPTVRTVKTAWPGLLDLKVGSIGMKQDGIILGRKKKITQHLLFTHRLLWLHKNPSQRSALSCRPCRSINKWKVGLQKLRKRPRHYGRKKKSPKYTQLCIQLLAFCLHLKLFT